MFPVERKVVLLVVAVSALGAASALAVRAEEPKQGHEASEKVPATLDGIWHEVQEHHQQLESSIKNRQLSSVHEDAFHIRDLVAAMADKSAMLPTANLEKVKTSAKFLATLAGRLDESGDANDQARTEAVYAKFSDLLKTIEAQYPPEALKYKGTSGEKE